MACTLIRVVGVGHRIACSIFTIVVVSRVLAGPAEACWLPGGDGSCPSGGGSSAPSYHSYGDPHLLKLGGALVLVISSADDADQYTGYAGDVREEIALPGSELTATDLPDGYAPSFSCGNVCIGAWHTQEDATVRVAIRGARGWSAPIAFEPAIRSPAAAAFGDLLFVAWSSWVDGVGARVELRRLDPLGHVTGSWTLATGASHGHLSVTASAIGGLVTWQRVDEPPDGTSSAAWVDAQLLDSTGAPAGAPLELAIPEGDTDYYRGAPAVFAGGVYRVVHGGLGAGVPWFVVDPTARTIALDPLADALPGPIGEIVPLADGLALSIDANVGGVVRVAGGRVAQVVALDGRATIAPVAGGGLVAAYALGGSVYVASIPSTFDGVGAPQEVAARYLVDSGGCSATRGGGGGGLVVVASALVAIARRRRSLTGCRVEAPVRQCVAADG